MAEEIQKKKISELPSAVYLSDGDVMPVVQSSGSSEATKKVDIGLVGSTVAESKTFSNLDTTSKTLVGAINEVNSSLGNVPSADEISYDNTSSGLSASDVQGAIDEIAQGGSGGSTVTVTQIQSTGTKIATITVDSIGTDLYAPNGGGSGGHTILDNEGTSLTQRDDLQFKGAYSEDDSTEGKTVVNVVRSMTKAEFDELTEAEKTGLINITDETGSGSDIINELLFQNSDTTNPQQIDLTSAYTNYDFIIIRTHRVADNRIYIYDNLFNCNELALNSVIQGIGWFGNNNYWAYTITSETQFTLTKQGEEFYIYKIYGIKIGANSLHNYSEDEQIVGKWIDGKTLYEKTVATGGSVPTGATLIERIVQTGYDTIRYTKT